MLILRTTFIMILFIFISSCANFDELVYGIDCSKNKIKINYNSTIDTDIDIQKADEIAVIPFDNEDIISRNHINDAIRSLNKKGFTNVFKGAPKSKTKYVAYISLNSKTESYEYAYDKYGYKGTGKYLTICRNGYCELKEEKVYGVIGKTVETRHSTINDLHIRLLKIMSITESGQQQTMKVMDLVGKTLNNMHNKDYLYTLLIEETISRMNFLKSREEYNYIIDLQQK